MRILITGGAGFIGSNVVDAFITAGHDVAIVDDLSSGSSDNVHRGARWYRLDIGNAKLDAVFAEERPEVVCHHAAQVSVRRSVEAPQADALANVLGSLNVFEQLVLILHEAQETGRQLIGLWRKRRYLAELVD